MALPTFIIVGAAKSGTSALYSYLAQHPEIFMSSMKESGFFSMLDEGPPPSSIPGGATRDRRDESRRRYLESQARAVTTMEDYKKLFSEAGNRSIIGDVSPFYLYNPRTAARIRASIPSARLIAILRNPIERAYSHFSHYQRDGLERLPSLEAAIDEEDIAIDDVWWGYRHYIRAGFYGRQLGRYYETFPREQLLVLLYDDLRNEFDGSIQKILAHVGADDSFRPDTRAKHNVSGRPRSETLHRILSRPNHLRTAVKRILPVGLQRSIKNSKVLGSLRAMNLRRTALPEATRERLCSIYAEDIRQTERLIERSLNHWLE